MGTITDKQAKYFSDALVDCAIIIGASISGTWGLLFLLLLNHIEVSS